MSTEDVAACAGCLKVSDVDFVKVGNSDAVVVAVIMIASCGHVGFLEDGGDDMRIRDGVEDTDIVGDLRCSRGWRRFDNEVRRAGAEDRMKAGMFAWGVVMRFDKSYNFV